MREFNDWRIRTKDLNSIIALKLKNYNGKIYWS